MATGKLVEAREAFLSVGRIAVQPAETSRSVAARKESAELAEAVRPRIPSLVVHIVGVPEDSVAVTIDGAAVPTAALIAPRLVDPGSHRIVATTTSGGNAQTTVEPCARAKSRNVELKIVLTGGNPVPAAVPALVPPGDDDRARALRRGRCATERRCRSAGVYRLRRGGGGPRGRNGHED